MYLSSIRTWNVPQKTAAVLLVLFAGFLAQLISSPVRAEESAKTNLIEIGWRRSFETRKLPLPQGRRANVKVVLMSFGDTVGGYGVSIVDVKAERIVGTRRSNEHGEAVFRGLPPGRYTAVLRMTKRARNRTTVQIGDILLQVARQKGQRKRRPATTQ